MKTIIQSISNRIRRIGKRFSLLDVGLGLRLVRDKRVSPVRKTVAGAMALATFGALVVGQALLAASLRLPGVQMGVFGATLVAAACLLIFGNLYLLWLTPPEVTIPLNLERQGPIPLRVDDRAA